MSFINDIFFLLFPPSCAVCGRLLTETEKSICSFCLLELPRTNYHSDKESPVAKLFWGRVDITHVSSWFHFYKGSPYQGLLHKLKYKGQKEVGIDMGRYFAAEIRNTEFAAADLIIPVPLHPGKKRKRGYNQSEMIARGMNKIFNIRMDTTSLIRTNKTETQTKKNRFERFLNMEGNFIVTDREAIINKSVLLIDDVVTTGSTLEACATVLLEKGCREVLILTLAVA